MSFELFPPIPFVGRESEIDFILARVTANTPTIIYGSMGMGKSSVVASLLHHSEVERHFPDGILYISLGQKPDVGVLLAEPARTRGLKLVSVFTPEDTLKTFHQYLNYQRKLMVIDDVWDIHDAQRFVFGGYPNRTILTTRLHEVAHYFALRSDDILKLQPMNEAQAMALLQGLAPHVMDQYRELMRAVVLQLEGLPLLIYAVGEILQKGIYPLPDFLGTLIQKPEVLLSLPLPSNYSQSSNEMLPNVAALFHNNLRLLSLSAQSYLWQFGPTHAKPAIFSLADLQSLWSVEDAKPVIRELVNYGLLNPLGSGYFQVSTLLVTYLKSRGTNLQR